MSFDQLQTVWKWYKSIEQDLDRQRREAFQVFLDSVAAYKKSGGKKFGLSKAMGNRNWDRIKDVWERADEA